MRFLIVAGIVLTVLLLSLMVSKKKKLYADKFLVAYLLFAAINQAYIYFETTEGLQGSYWMLFGKGIYLLNPPLFFLYIYALSRQRLLEMPWLAVVFVPFVAYSVHFLFYYFYVFDHVSIQINSGLLYVDQQLSFSWTAFVILFLLIEPVFLICFFIVLKDYQKRIRESVSSIDRMHLTWLNTMFYLCVVISVILVPLGTLTVGRSWLSVETLQVTIEIATVAFYFILGFYGFRQTTVFTNLDLVNEKPETTARPSYERSGLSPIQAKEYHSRLLAIMETSKPYLNGELTAAQLSGQLGISVNHLSQILNKEQNQNFFDFVNGYRVKEVILKMQDRRNNHLTLLAIALDSGFNSKTSFNSVFKKITNKTPSQFQKSVV